MRAAFALALTLAASHAYASCDTRAPQRCDPMQMQVIDLGTIGTGISYATAINAAGQVAGSFKDAVGMGHAFLYSAGAMTALPEPAGTVSSWANGINKSGEVVGAVNILPSNVQVRHGMAWRNGQMHSLGPWANGLQINDSGVIFGTSETGWALWTKFVPAALDVYRQDSNCGPRQWPNGYPMALNNSGEVVGGPGTDSGAYLYYVGTSQPCQTNSTLVIREGTFNAVNNHGEAVGTKDNEVLIYINGVSRNKIGPFSSTLTNVSAVNDHGMIIGNYWSATKTSPSSFMMEPNGTIFDLNALYNFTAATTPASINASGWIVGSAMFNGIQHAALLIWK